MKQAKAIPTEWNGINFRSRLEARWAAFFSLCGIKWLYEPVDLEGYIPDFIVQQRDELLVEVKPITRHDNPEIAAAHKKIAESGWTGKAMVVGAQLFDGFTLDVGFDRNGRSLFLGTCPTCHHFSIVFAGCEFCGGGIESGVGVRKTGMRIWNLAGNQVQWQSSRVNEPTLMRNLIRPDRLP